MAHQSALHIAVLCKRRYYISIWIWIFSADFQQEFEKIQNKDSQVIHAVFWSWCVLGHSFDHFRFSGPYLLLCKYVGMNIFDKAAFTHFTCDSEILRYFWICVCNHGEAKGTSIFACGEQNLTFWMSDAFELYKFMKKRCDQGYNHCI